MDPRWLAAVNLVLGLIAFSWLMLRTSRRYSEYPNEIRLLLASLIVTLFSLLILSTSDFFHPTSTFNTVTITAAKCFLLYSLWATSATKFRTGTRTADGNLGQDQNKDVL